LQSILFLSMSEELIVGIDLGTTNSELAVVREQVDVVPIHGEAIMPSCVGLDANGQLIVGQAAKNQLVAAPDHTILSIKRKMGDGVKVPLGDQQFSPEEISSFILRELKQEGERFLGQAIGKAVITVPAFFNERQRKATQVAGELAGLEVVRILNEPTAAALAYGAGVKEGETMLVYDLGGGTFDVSLVVVEQGVVEVKASHGDTHLGGDDFDQLLVDHAVLEFKRQHNIDLIQDSKTLRRLKVVMERAKRTLSDEPFVKIREEYLDGQHHLEMELARDEYEAMILPLLEKTLGCVHQSLNDARLAPKDIHKVMLVGGATRTPLVHRLIQEKLGLEPRFEINPDLIVAMGASIQAGVIAGRNRHSILVDITPHTFSTTAVSFDTAGGEVICVPIIPRNTPLPASKSELVLTLFDEQEKVKVEAYQGEGRLPSDNTFIGDFMVEGLSKVPADNPIVIHFDLDLNGLLKVTATEKVTGLAKTVAMDTRGHKVLNLDEARRNIASLVGEPQAPPQTAAAPEPAKPGPAPGPETLLNTAKDLRKRAEVLVEKNIGADDAEEIRGLLHESALAIKERDWKGLEQKNDALSDLLFYLEE
jgi:molecular chaperone DnaK